MTFLADFFVVRDCEVFHRQGSVGRGRGRRGSATRAMPDEEAKMAEAKRILVIDDDEDLVQSTTALLRARGFDADGARNGTEGLAKIRARRPDLLVLDIMMDHDTEGFQLAYKLKADAELKGLPVIIVSSFQEHLAQKMDSFQFVLGNDWPAEALLEKPVKPDLLAETIGKVLADVEARKAAVA
mgnify:CR=1 FL=1